MGDSFVDAKEELPQYERNSSDHHEKDLYHTDREPTHKSSKLNSCAPPQDHPDFPFHLPPNTHAHLTFHHIDSTTNLILPSGAASTAPLYTLKHHTTGTITKKYSTDLFRNNDRKADWYDPEKPVASARVHTHCDYLDFRFNKLDGTKMSMDGFFKPDMFKKRPFPWPTS